MSDPHGVPACLELCCYRLCTLNLGHGGPHDCKQHVARMTAQPHGVSLSPQQIAELARRIDQLAGAAADCAVLLATVEAQQAIIEKQAEVIAQYNQQDHAQLKQVEVAQRTIQTLREALRRIRDDLSSTGKNDYTRRRRIAELNSTLASAGAIPSETKSTT